MGEMADALIEQGLDNKAMHESGMCYSESCEYCQEEYEKYLKTKKPESEDPG